MRSHHEIREVCQTGKDRDPGWYRIHRRLSIHVTALLLDTPVTLNQVSLLMMAMGAIGAALCVQPSLAVNAVGWACLYLSFLLDKVDGEMARFRRGQSVIGILFDRFHHRLIEPLLFLAVGTRAYFATHSTLPLFAALASMLAANIVEETQQLPAFIAAKHARETRRWPVRLGVTPPAWLQRVAGVMRSLKTFRTFITLLPLVAGAYLAEAATGRPVTTWLLLTSAAALWAYVVFQACYYTAGQLEAEIDTLTRELPELPAQDASESPAAPAAAAPARPERGPMRGIGAIPLAILVLGLAFAGSATAGTYYVDVTSAQCTNNGNNAGSLSQPYCSISAALAARGTAGNTILVKAGTYRETVTFPASGTSSLPIVLRAFGNGVVTVDGADDFSQTNKWSKLSGNVYVASTVNWAPLQVFASGARLTASTASPSSLPSGTFRYVAGSGLYVNVGGGNPASHTPLVGRRANAFVLSGKSWITIDGFTATRTEDRGFNITSSSNDLQILNNKITFTNKYGIYVSDCARVRIAGNLSTDNNNHGIELIGATTACLIEDNEAARNALPGVRSANGIYLYGATGNTIRRNKWHDNQDTGEHIQSGANNNISQNNLSWNNGDHGFDHLGTTGTVHIGDVAYNNYKDGFSIEGTCPNTTVIDCIAVNNGLTTGEFDLWVDNSSRTGLVSNNNIFWNSTGQAPVKYISTIYSTVAAYSAVSGQDTRSLQVDPKFMNAAAANFHLQPSSPAIDNADSSPLNWPAIDADGSARVDVFSIPNDGLGPVPYADRGAYEYQPSGLPPVAALTATPSVGTAPATVTLSAAGSTDPEGNISTYQFDFGDGGGTAPQASPTTTHTYAAGTYTATVTVVDAFGLGGTATTTVISNQAPVAALSVAPTTGRSPLTVTANAGASSDPDGTVASYRFDFGDGTVVGPQAGSTASHSYGTGVWQATVTVTDDRGASSTLATPVTVNVGAPNQPPTAALTLTPTLGGAPLLVTADASASHDPDGGIVSYRFDFGDGTIVGPQPGATATHTFAGGTFTVAVTVTDTDGGTAGASRSVTVTTANQPPNGTISAPVGNATISAGQSVLCTSVANDPEGQTPITYAWDFGGGAPGTTQQNPGPIVFSNPGTYTMTLTVRDALGLADPTPDTRTVTVVPADPNVAADEIHWTLTSQTSVTFDWRGPMNTIRYGLTTDYGQTATAVTPNPVPWSSPGPFWEARINGLAENTVYHYAIGNSADHTFHTPPPRGSSGFTIMAEADIGDATLYPPVAAVQSQIAAQTPSFVLCIGDLTYANENTQAAVDRHFNDMQAWSRDAAYMPAWGNHEWESVTDDLRNYKGRFDLPHAKTTPDVVAPNDGGEDWYWFDNGNVRFIAYPEPTSGAWDNWYPLAAALMDSAQADPAITQIVTFGHRPAYSSGHHSGEPKIKGYLDQLGATHSKYVLNLNGHSHNYERTYAQSGVVHVTVGTGGSTLETDPNGTCVWGGGCPAPSWSAFRAFHRGSLRLRFTSGGIEGTLFCGPAGPSGTNADDVSCEEGTVLDAFTIGNPTPNQAPVVASPGTVTAAEGGTLTVPVTATDPDGDPVQTLTADLSRLPAGNDAVFTTAPDLSSGLLTWHPTLNDSGTYTVTFSASNDLAGSTITTLHVQNSDRAPTVNVPASVYDIREDSTLVVAVTASDADGDAIANLTASLSPTPAGSTLTFTPGPGNTSGTLSWHPSFVDAGTYTLTFTAANALSGSQSATVNVTNVDRVPVLSAPASATGEAGEPIALSFTVADPDNDAITSLTANLGELPAGNDAVFTPSPDNHTATLTWTPRIEDAGFFHVTFTASNALSASVTTAINIGRNDEPPVIFSPALAEANEGAPFSLGITAADPDSNVITSLTADLSALPQGNSASFTAGSGNRTGTLAWTPGFADSGSYTVRFIAANALAETTFTVVHVNNTDRSPVVSAPASTSKPAATLVQVIVTASDADGDAITSLTANLATLPAGNTATFTAASDKRSGTFSWTPASGDTGSFPVVFTASNAGSGQATTTLIITRPNQPPVAVLTLNRTTGNAPLAVTADASGSSDPDGSILSYRFDFGDGVVVGPQTAATAAHSYAAGVWTARLTVTDPFGAVNTVTSTVTVASVGPGSNLVANASFESNLLGWNSYSGGVLTRVSGGFDGGSCVQIASPSPAVPYGVNDSPNYVGNAGAVGTRYRFGAWVRSASSLGSARLQIREYLNNVKVGPTYLSTATQLQPGWQFLTIDVVTQAAGSTLDYQVYESPVIAGEVFQVDNISIYLVPAGAPAMTASLPTDSTGTVALQQGLDPAAGVQPGSTAVGDGSADAAELSGPALQFRAWMTPTVARPDATLHFVTTRPGSVQVDLFDASGRRVRQALSDANLAPGLHHLQIDGRSDRGDRLGSGVYFYRVQASERSAVGRFVLIH